MQCAGALQGGGELPGGRAQHHHGDVGQLPLPGLRHELGGACAERWRQVVPGK